MPHPEASGVRWFATKGSGTNEAARMEALLRDLPGAAELPFDKNRKRESFFGLLAALRRHRPRLLVMEGTGVAGGLACLLGRWVWGVPYVFSSGDAVGPFVQSLSPILGPLFGIYERLLCRWSAGFIGWTPYLCGRAMTCGAPRSMTAAGWPIGKTSDINPRDSRTEWRAKWGIPDTALVVGLVGSLAWNPRRRYCYGLDLVSAAVRLSRDDLIIVVVGEGDGRDRLRALAGKFLGTRIRIPGPVALDEVLPCLAAFDVAALPQSTDGVGAFRYTTKLSEYAVAKLPVITSRIPAAYDLGIEWMWRLPGRGPWEETYINALARLLEKLDVSQITVLRQAIPQQLEVFNRQTQINRMTAFINDILKELSPDSTPNSNPSDAHSHP